MLPRLSPVPRLKPSLDSNPFKPVTATGAALWINGGAGGHAAEVVSRFASMHQLSYDCSCGSETLNFDLLVHTTVEGATARALSVLWLYMSQPLLDPKALDRFKSRIKRSEQSFSKSVERTTTHKVWPPKAVVFQSAQIPPPLLRRLFDYPRR